VNIQKLILLRKCKPMAEMLRIFLKMLGTLKKISNCWISCQIRVDRGVGRNSLTNLEEKELFKI
jgi:hypothetical protein